MKIVLALLMTLSFSLQAKVVSMKDNDNKCTLYRVTTEETPALDEEIIISDKDAYGFTFQDMEVQFKNQTVTVQPMINVVLGFNRALTNSKSIIKASNPEFKFLVNQLNRKIYALEKVCINKNNEIIYAKQFETTTK